MLKPRGQDAPVPINIEPDPLRSMRVVEDAVARMLREDLDEQRRARAREIERRDYHDEDGRGCP